MAFDRRVRKELHAEVERTRPDLDRQLAIVQARSRQVGAGVGPLRRTAGAMAATLHLLTVATVAAVIALVIVLRVLGPLPIGGGIDGPSPSATSVAPSPSAPDFLAIAGTYSTTLTPSEAAVSAGQLAGIWTITLQRNGTMTLVAPRTFPDSVNGISGVSFSLEGDRFRTDLFYSDYCQSVGAYRWVRASARLTFTQDGDPCAIRRALLSTLPWDAAP